MIALSILVFFSFNHYYFYSSEIDYEGLPGTEEKDDKSLIRKLECETIGGLTEKHLVSLEIIRSFVQQRPVWRMASIEASNGVFVY